ncbi:MAG TPA: hypothetical protein VGX45_05000 [Solirubrobacteraceae bacterium]|nr:hypothetical protein [Solirubrobacteraceae bacterium]
MTAANESSVSLDAADPRDGHRPVIRLGLVVTPVLDSPAVANLAEEVERALAERYPDVGWSVSAVRDSLVTAPTPLAEVVDAARSRLLDEQWDLVVHVTELPLRISRRPLLTHSSRTHRAAVVSLPALGLKQSNRRLVESVVDAVGVFAGDTERRRGENRRRHRRSVRRRLVELATDVEGSEALDGVTLLHRVATGNVRLVLGMVRANHPWRLVVRLSRALIGALGVAAFAVITSDVWRIAVTLSPLRLALLCMATIATAVATLIATHGLWERATDRRVREQAILFNLVTVITVAIGILALYAAVCVLSLAAAAIMVDPSVLARQIGRRSGFGDYLRLVLLAGALATVGGTLGGALESDTAVREAAYAQRRERS